MMEMLTSIALSVFKTLDNIATPCSVNAKGAYRGPPHLEVANCVLKMAHSSLVNSNIKSIGFASLKLRESKKTL
jgi:hypothetical protein